MTSPDPRPVALISGGSRGIGRAVVQALAADGHDVAFGYRSRSDAAGEVVAEANRVGARALACQVDVTDPEAVRSFVARVEAELGPIVSVVTSAGIIRDRNLLTMADDDWHAVLDTNLTGTFHVCRATIFPMLKRRRGSIVAISSMAGVYGQAGQANYCAAKAGIIGFTKSLAKEVGSYGIRVNAVTPGYIATDMTVGLNDRLRESLVRRIPLGRMGKSGEVAALVSFLTSDRAAYITAGVFSVDGGITL